MLFKPGWAKSIPAHLTPDTRTIKALEALRRETGIPDDLFACKILSSSLIIRRMQGECYGMLRMKYPRAPEKELLKTVLVARYMGTPIPVMTEEGIDLAMTKINSFDDLYEYIIALERKLLEYTIALEDLAGKPQAGFDALQIQERIDEILAQRDVSLGRRERRRSASTGRPEVRSNVKFVCDLILQKDFGT